MKGIKILLLIFMLFISTGDIANAKEYTIIEGDQLWKIAKDNDTTIGEIARLNGIDNVNFIIEGETLKLPPKVDVIESKIEAVQNWEIEGFDQAESVLFVPGHDFLYVSNVNEAGKGYISKISREGKMIDEKFANNIPFALGLAYHDDRIYVASTTSIKVIDIETGELEKDLVAKDGGMLNDVTFSPDGDLYVTDFLGKKIYTSNGDELVVWYETDEFIMLNGIYFDYGRLLVSNMNMADLTGSVLSIDVKTKEISVVKSMENIGSVDGISKLGNKYIASNATTRELILFTDNSVEVIGVFEGGMADISVNQTTGEIYLPFLEKGKVESILIK